MTTLDEVIPKDYAFREIVVRCPNCWGLSRKGERACTICHGTGEIPYALKDCEVRR